MGKEVLVSFIIPIYNVEKYLKQCIDSIINQTFENKEILLINDGSTDDSLDICREYEEKYEYIRVFNKKNGGQSSARNMGIKEAKGEYIQFVDSDDWLSDKESTEKMYSLCKKHNLDIIRGKYSVLFEESNTKSNLINLINFKYINKKVRTRDYFNECIRCGVYEVTPILGLIKRSVILENNIWFTEGVKMEDNEFTLKLLTTNSELMVMQLDYEFYIYRRRKNSTTTNYCLKNIIDILVNFDLINKYINCANLEKNVHKNAKKVAGMSIYHLTSIYGRLTLEDKLKADTLIDKSVLKYSIKNSINFHQKIKVIIFTYFRPFMNLIYKIKLK